MTKKILIIIFGTLCSCMFAQEQVADSLRNKLMVDKNPSEKLDTYISLARYYKHQSPIKGRGFLKLAKGLASQIKDTVSLFKIAEIEASIYYILGDSEKEITIIKEAVLLVQHYKNKELEARAFKLLGNAFYEALDYESQLKNYLKSYAIAKKIQDTTLQISLYNAIGVAYGELKMPKKSLIYYEKGLQLYNQISSPISKSTAGTLWGNSGISYDELGNYEEALRRARIAKKIRVSIKHWGQIGGSNHDIANTHEKLQQLDSAIFYNKQGIANYKKIKNNGGLLAGYKNLARIYEKKNLFKDALRYKKREDSLQGLIVNITSLKKQAYLLAEIEYEKKIGALNFEKITLQQTSFNRRHIGIFIFFLLLCVLISIVFIRKENIKNKEINKMLSASNNEKEILLKEVHHRVKNNLQLISSLLRLQGLIVNITSLKKQAYLLAEIEYEKKIGALNFEKITLQQTSFNRRHIGVFIFFVLLCVLISIVFIRKENVKNKEINKMLSASNNEKEILLKEVHHRVKNNLQLISSLLRLQAKTVTDEKIKQILLEATDRIKSISLVHQRLYERGAFREVQFKSYASQIIENLIASYNSITNVDVEINTNEDIDIDFAIALGLILNEIATNTLKHNQSQKKIKIEVTFILKNNTYELKVSDNGKGFDIDTVEQKKTLGLRLISILTNQLEGKSQITSKKNIGVTYFITIPTN